MKKRTCEVPKDIKNNELGRKKTGQRSKKSNIKQKKGRETMTHDQDLEFGRIGRQVSNQLSQAIRILEDAKDKCLRTKYSAYQRIALDEEAGIPKTIDEIRQLISRVQSL
jgi:hypothetical protein